MLYSIWRQFASKIVGFFAFLRIGEALIYKQRTEFKGVGRLRIADCGYSQLGSWAVGSWQLDGRWQMTNGKTQMEVRGEWEERGSVTRRRCLTRRRSEKGGPPWKFERSCGPQTRAPSQRSM